MDLRIFLSCIFISLVLHVVFSDSSSFIDLSKLDYSILHTFHARNIQFTFNSNMANMKINCSKCHGQRHVTCQENDFINVAIQLQGSKQTISVPFNVSCSLRSDSKNTFIVDPINTSSKNNEIFVNWTRPSSTIKEYLVYCMTSTTHQCQQISTNQMYFDNLSENTWHQVCIASIDNLWRTSIFTCRHVNVTNVSDSVTTRKYIKVSTKWLSAFKTSKMHPTNKTNRKIWPLHVVLIIAVTTVLLLSVFLTRKYHILGKLKYETRSFNRSTLERLSRSIPLVNNIRNTIIQPQTNTVITEEDQTVQLRLRRDAAVSKQPAIILPIPVARFHQHYQKAFEENHKKLTEEFKELKAASIHQQKIHKLSKDVGRMSENVKKNRFQNILPYDQHRVVLEHQGNYVNASFVPFVNNSDPEYIAAQGPIEQTLSDFWYMILENNVNCIVMLTSTNEDNKKKCYQYWPESVGEKLVVGENEELEVSLDNEVDNESYILRGLKLKSKTDKNSRNIRQIHMDKWSDYSAPDLEDFDKMLMKFHEISPDEQTCPFLIHCSAGVGRTGTFICIDRIVKQLVCGSPEIDIFNTVIELRKYRQLLVQKISQYTFVHEYIDHYLKKYIATSNASDHMYCNDTR